MTLSPEQFLLLRAVTLSDPAESTFRGFFVQSRLSADGTSRVGTFAVTSPGHSQLSPCPRPEVGRLHYTHDRLY